LDHVAIMNKKTDDYLKWIVNGEKSVESRWYKHKYAPWDRINEGDTVYFKYTGEKVTVEATVEKIIQYEDLNEDNIEEIWNSYGKEISPGIEDMSEMIEQEKVKLYKYCVLIFVKDVKKIEPFAIDKRGYGNMAAWIVIEDIDTIKIT